MDQLGATIMQIEKNCGTSNQPDVNLKPTYHKTRELFAAQSPKFDDFHDHEAYL